MKEAIIPLIGEGVLTSAVLTALGLFHRSAVNAHRTRADEWHRAWTLERQISAEGDRQIASLVGAVRRATGEAGETS